MARNPPRSSTRPFKKAYAARRRRPVSDAKPSLASPPNPPHRSFPRKCRTSAVYKALNSGRREIRILHVRGNANKEDILDCTLETVSLHSEPKPQYEAISYCWGELQGSSQMRVNGVIVDAPASAIRALRRFRPEAGSRALWIDAICINQADLIERAEQVSRMEHVYRNTSTCLIWLGESRANSALILKSIRFISETLFPQLFPRDDGMTVARDVVYNPLNPSDLFEEGITAQGLIIFFELSWFSRLWVLQEATLPTKALCHWGDYQIPWRHVSRAATWMLDEFPRAERILSGIQYSQGSFTGLVLAEQARRLTTEARVRGTNNTDQQNFVPFPLSTILCNSVSFQASDPRDKFYGILGLVDWPAQRERYLDFLKVDYTRSVQDVSIDATRAAIIQDGSLQILEYTDSITIPLEDFAREDICSWCFALDAPFVRYRYMFFTACRSGDRPVNLTAVSNFENTNVLNLSGYEVSRVTRVLTSKVFDFRDKEKLLGRMVNEAVELLMAAERSDLIWALMSAMTTSLNIPPRTSRSESIWLNFANVFVAFCMKHREQSNDETQAAADLDGVLEPLFKEALWLCCRRRFFLTSDGRVGLGHESVQENDCIAVLFGSEYPCILRPAVQRRHTHKGRSAENSTRDTTERNDHRFVGVANVPGIMDGEAVEAFEAMGTAPTMFSLW